MSDKKHIDVNCTKSEKKGASGLFESYLRKLKGISFIFPMIPVALAYIVALSVAIAPGYMIMIKTYFLFSQSNLLIQGLAIGASFALAYGCFIFSIILVVPFLNWLNPFKVKPWRGNWYSTTTIPWYYHNALVQLVRYTVLDFITPTPLNLLFFKLMGMKIGKNCVINTSNISDPCLITLEDNVTIGGSATIFGHYAQKGILILAPVIIKKGATIGLKASIMGDVIVSEGKVIGPNEVLLPKTRV